MTCDSDTAAGNNDTDCRKDISLQSDMFREEVAMSRLRTMYSSIEDRAS